MNGNPNLDRNTTKSELFCRCCEHCFRHTSHVGLNHAVESQLYISTSCIISRGSSHLVWEDQDGPPQRNRATIDARHGLVKWSRIAFQNDYKYGVQRALGRGAASEAAILMAMYPSFTTALRVNRYPKVVKFLIRRVKGCYRNWIDFYSCRSTGCHSLSSWWRADTILGKAAEKRWRCCSSPRG